LQSEQISVSSSSSYPIALQKTQGSQSSIFETQPNPWQAGQVSTGENAGNKAKSLYIATKNNIAATRIR
jgi:hypothetical protein